MIYGYARVSSADQNLDRQLKHLEESRCDQIFQEKLSGATTKRPELQKMLDELKQGDVVVVSDLTRISRSTRDLFELVDIIKGKGAALKSIKEPWLDTTSDNPYSEFLLTVMAGVSELERKLIRQRQSEGVAIAKERGAYKGRTPKYTSDSKELQQAIELVKKRHDTGMSMDMIAKACGMSRKTLYTKLKENGIEV